MDQKNVAISNENDEALSAPEILLDKETHWLKENSQAIQYCNKLVEEHGMFASAFNSDIFNG